MKDEKQHLLVQYAVARSLAESASLEEATPEILRAVCEGLGWQFGALWIVDREADVLRSFHSWRNSSVELAEFEKLSQQPAFTRGEGLPGRVWANGEPEWVTDIATKRTYPRSAIAVEAGLHAAFCFPILLGGQSLGAMEFFSRDVRPPDEALLHMMQSLGSQIGQFIERRRAEDSLRESEDRYRVVAETASDAIITIDTNSRIVFINRIAEHIFGHKLEEMLNQDLTMLMPDYLRHLHHAGIERYVETGQRHISWDGVELPGLHKEGHEIPLEVSFSEFTRHGQRFFTGIARDITERKRAEAEREQSDQRYSILIEAIPQQVWTAQPDGALDYVNQRVLDYFGRTMEEMLGWGWQDMLHPDDVKICQELWSASLRTGELYKIEFRLRRASDASYRWHLGRALPLRDGRGQIVKWFGTNTDIQEQKQLEETLESINREREQMLEEISTPLVPVWRGVLALPLIGSLDTERMQKATDAALAEVMRTGARACIIDITGARLIDSHAVANLSHLVSSLKLIGAEAIVTGVTAHAAQTLVGLGIDLAGMRTYRTLAEALAQIIKLNGNRRDGEIKD